MKKVSANLFFTVLWRGICQALGWFFGLFGYKREGAFAKCVWGLFAVSASIIAAFIALVMVCSLSERIYERYLRKHQCNVEDCYYSECVGRNIYFHNTMDGKGYVYNTVTGEKTLEDVLWIARPLGNDSLICFSNGEKRGYFSKHTGKVVIEPKYSHAWVFSDGLASVEERGVINFIDATGKVVMDMNFQYFNGMEGYVFHGGYCVIYGDGLDMFGLIDKTGRTVLPCIYNSICPTCDHDMWCLKQGKKMAVFNKELEPVIPFTECEISVCEGTIDMTMPDHTIRKYNMQGELINDFYVSSVRMLEYEKEEIVYRKNVVTKVCDEITEIQDEDYHPKATARLRSYVAGDGYEGLMTADGHVVTPPQYQTIEAIGQDSYLCETTNCDKVILNGKGEIVR